jgi:methylmalonyl-CoA/ethylmalonyl-CoA epimerase
MTTLGHIGYVVRDMAGALARFQAEGAVLKIAPTQDPQQRVSVCVLQLEGGPDVELVAPLDESAPIRARLQRGGGLDHLCYQVDDLEQSVHRETERGALLVCPPCYAVAFDADVAFVHRRSGLLVELMRFRTPHG